MNFESEYLKPIPQLTDIGNWKDITIMDNNEPLVDIDKFKSKKIVFSNYYKNMPFNEAIDTCYLRETVFRKLLQVANRLPSNFSLLIYDGWRPLKLQKEIYAHYRNNAAINIEFLSEEELDKYVAQFVSPGYIDPKSPSPHFTGGSVDINIIDINGHELDMGTKFDDLSNAAYTEHFENMFRNKNDITEREFLVLKNRRLLYNLMSEEDFTSYKFEWWHFDYGNQLWGKTKGKMAIYGLAEPSTHYI